MVELFRTLKKELVTSGGTLQNSIGHVERTVLVLYLSIRRSIYPSIYPSIHTNNGAVFRDQQKVVLMEWLHHPPGLTGSHWEQMMTLEDVYIRLPFKGPFLCFFSERKLDVNNFQGVYCIISQALRKNNSLET